MAAQQAPFNDLCDRLKELAQINSELLRRASLPLREPAAQLDRALERTGELEPPGSG